MSIPAQVDNQISSHIYAETARISVDRQYHTKQETSLTYYSAELAEEVEHNTEGSQEDIHSTSEHTEDQSTASFHQQIHEAVSCGDFQTTEFVLRKRREFDLNTPYQGGKTLLIIAAERGHELVILTLLDSGADINCKLETSGRTALHFAAENGHDAATAILLAYGADPHQTDSANESAYDLAKRKEFENESVLCKEFQPYLSRKVEQSYVRSISTRQRISDALQRWRVAWLSPSTPKDIIGATKNQDVQALMEQLIEREEVDIRTLIQAREKDQHGWTALMWASDIGNHKIVKLLLERGANPNDAAKSNGLTALMLACRRGYLNVVKILLDYNADPNVPNNEDVSPLSIALYERRTAVALYLIHKGADISFADQHGWTPLIKASNEGNLQLVKVIADLGGDLNAQTLEGWSSIMVASDQGHVEVVKELVSRNAELNLTTTAGDTALHIAVHKNHPEVVEELIKLKQRLDLNARNENGLTAHMIATNKGHTHIADLLSKEGGAEVVEIDSNIDVLISIMEKRIEKWMPQTSNLDLEVKTVQKQAYEFMQSFVNWFNL